MRTENQSQTPVDRDPPRTPRHTRTEVSFSSGGELCAAWLYRPPHESGDAAPIVVMAHGLSGTRRDRLGPFAERFAAAGYLALVFDHRGFGDSGGEPDLFEPRRQLEDWRAAIAFARSRARRRPASASSRSARRWAAATRSPPPPADPRVAAAISQVPFLDIVRQAHRSSPRVTLRDARSRPRAGATCPPSARPASRRSSTRRVPRQGWRRVVAGGEDSRWRDRVSARWLLGRPFRPGRHARAPALPVARLRRRGRPRRAAGPGDRRRAPRAARRAAHVRRRRPLRHLRRPAARGRRRRPARLPRAPRRGRALSPGRRGAKTRL